MTNREWLMALSDKELARKLLKCNTLDICSFCIFDKDCPNEEHGCADGIEEWLKGEHKKW